MRVCLLFCSNLCYTYLLNRLKDRVNVIESILGEDAIDSPSIFEIKVLLYFLFPIHFCMLLCVYLKNELKIKFNNIFKWNRKKKKSLSIDFWSLAEWVTVNHLCAVSSPEMKGFKFPQKLKVAHIIAKVIRPLINWMSKEAIKLKS